MTRRVATVFSSSPILLGLCTAVFVIVYLCAIPPSQYISLDYLSWAPLSSLNHSGKLYSGPSRYWDFMASSDRLNAIVKQQGQRIIARFIIGSPYRPRVGQWLDGRDIRYGKIIKGSPVILGVMVKIIQVIDTFQGTRSVAVSNAWLPCETVGDMFAVCYKPELVIQRDDLVEKVM